MIETAQAPSLFPANVPPLPSPRLAIPALTFRAARVEDAAAIAGLFRSTYGYSSHPCLNEETVFRSIDEQSSVWRLSVDEGRIIACAAAMRNRWNRSWEIGCCVVTREYRGVGLSIRLAQESTTAALKSPECDLVFAYPRNAIAARITVKLDPEFHFTGYDGGRHISNASREHHAFCCAMNYPGRFRHVVPREPSLASTSFVKEQIFTPLGLSPSQGEYPPCWLVGNSDRGSQAGSFSIQFDPLSPSGAMEVTGYAGRAQHGRQVADELARLLEDHGDPRYVRLAVPVDKVTLIASLMSQGFELAGYLPAWFFQGGERFDCVMLVRTRTEAEPEVHGIWPIIDRIRRGLSVAMAPQGLIQ